MTKFNTFLEESFFLNLIEIKGIQNFLLKFSLNLSALHALALKFKLLRVCVGFWHAN